MSSRDRGESVAECLRPTASRRHQARPAGLRMACVVTASASGVPTTSAAAAFVAAAVAADQIDSESASAERHRHEV